MVTVHSANAGTTCKDVVVFTSNNKHKQNSHDNTLQLLPLKKHSLMSFLPCSLDLDTTLVSPDDPFIVSLWVKFLKCTTNHCCDLMTETHTKAESDTKAESSTNDCEKHKTQNAPYRRTNAQHANTIVQNNNTTVDTSQAQY